MDLLHITLLFKGAGPIIGWIGAFVTFICLAWVFVYVTDDMEDEEEDEDYL